MLALYRRYRPESFAEVIGQDHVTEPLRAALSNNRVNHAYLFSGPRGCGKTTSARILARTLNCEKAPVADPCGECQSCRDLARGGSGSIDVIEIDAASHGGVDDARDLRERAFFAPVASRYKVYIIDEAHMVTTQGFNALLKLVEEPPEHLKFIFATTEPEKVIPTIRSRTHHYPFRLIPPRVLSDYLAQICEQEGVRIEPAALPLVVRAGAGSARDSLSVLDQLLGGAGSDGVTYELTTSLLGYTPDTLLDEVVDAFAAGDGATVFAGVDKVIETGQDPRRFTEDLLRRLRDLVIVAAVPDAPASGLIDVPEDQAERLVAQAARFGRTELVRAADTVAAGLTEMRGATTPRLLLELICARVILPGVDDTADGLAARLDRLERRLEMGAMPVGTPAAAAPAPARQPEPPRAVDEPPAAPPAASAPPAPAQAAPEQPAQPAPAGAAAPQTPPQQAPPPQAAAPQAPPPQAAPEPAAPQQEAPAAPPAQPQTQPQTPAAPPAQPQTQAQTQPQTPAPASSGSLGLADARRIWPDLLDRVQQARRFSWILLSQNAQVVGLDGGILTLGFKNAGARDSFTSSGSDEILREAVVAAIGAEWRIEAIIDPSADPGADSGAGPAPRVVSPATEASVTPELADPQPVAAPQPASDAPPWDDPAPTAGPSASPPPDPEMIASARSNIAPTRTGDAPRAEANDDRDADASPDDPDVDDAAVGHTELLERELGATVIDEIPHQ